MSLQDKLDRLTSELEAEPSVPAEVRGALRRATDELIASGAADRAIMAGQNAPTFTLKDASGAIIRSNKLLDLGPLVVAFFLGAWCPYCDLELEALEEARSQIEQRGASLVAISMQTAAHSRDAARDKVLGFPVLVDFRGEIAAKFGIRIKMPDYLVELHKRLGPDLEEINGEGSWSLPMPALYVVGQDGVVAYSEVSPDFRHRSDPTHLLPILDCMARHRSY